MRPMHGMATALLAALVVAAGCKGSSGNTQCTTSADCASGELCTAGECARICVDSSDCGDAQVCTIEGFCIDDTRDRDRDGFAAATDCNDVSIEVNPDAQERPYDGLDNDCDPSTPDDDLDGDGWPREFDCDDSPETGGDTFPQAPELCDGKDNDCDENVDEAPSEGTTWYRDADSDGYGVATRTLQTCTEEPPDGYAESAGDCDDTRVDMHPNHPEVPGDGVANGCPQGGGAGAPLRIYAAAQTGTVETLLRSSGRSVGQRSSDQFSEIGDVAYNYAGGAERIYVSDASAGVFAWTQDGAPKPLLAPDGEADPAPSYKGIFVDHARNALIAATHQPNTVYEIPINASSGASVSTRLDDFPGEPVGAVGIRLRIPGTTLAHEQAVYVLVRGAPLGGDLLLPAETENATADVAYLPEPGVGVVPQRDGHLLVASEEGTLFRVAPWSGRVDEVTDLPTSTTSICSDVRRDDVLFGNSTSLSSAFKLYDAGNYSTTSVNASLEDITGCATNLLGDMDGDGFVARRFGGTDCDDASRLIHPEVTADAAGDGIDENCDGLDGMDADGDGNARQEEEGLGGSDCDDQSASEYFGNSGCGEPTSCHAVLQAFPRAQDGRYQIKVGADTQTLYCEMGLAGGGWTLVAHRRADQSTGEDCSGAANLDAFFTDGCGSAFVSEGQSYAMSRQTRNTLAFDEYLVVQYKGDRLDVGDAYILEPEGNNDLFPSGIGPHEVGLSRVCNVYGNQCESSDNLFWRYAGSGHLQGSCSDYEDEANSGFAGEYGLCTSDSGPLNGWFGNRNGEEEAKAWGRNTNATANDYHEAIFGR